VTSVRPGSPSTRAFLRSPAIAGGIYFTRVRRRGERKSGVEVARNDFAEIFFSIPPRARGNFNQLFDRAVGSSELFLPIRLPRWPSRCRTSSRDLHGGMEWQRCYIRGPESRENRLIFAQKPSVRRHNPGMTDASSKAGFICASFEVGGKSCHGDIWDCS
jgi:hypothetical protein